MKVQVISIIIISLFFLSVSKSKAQEFNCIQVKGEATKVIYPDSFNVYFFLQEEEKKIGYQTIGKVPLDSIKIHFFKALKGFKIDEKDLSVVKMSSRELVQISDNLCNILYVTKVASLEKAAELVTGLQCNGLKGVFVKGQYLKSYDQLKDSLYIAALENAKTMAKKVAGPTNKEIGEIIRVDFLNSEIPNNDSYDQYDTYNYTKFEYNANEKKKAFCNLRVEFELKK